MDCLEESNGPGVDFPDDEDMEMDNVLSKGMKKG